jgi:pyrroline-5-carboxylate reductase
MTEHTALLLVGCGKMGQALLQGWLDRDSARTISVIDPAPAYSDNHAVSFYRSPADLPPTAGFDAIVIAVKPQQLAATLPHYRKFSDSLFISIAAGQTLHTLASLLAPTTAIVRSMPNLPASIGQGMTVATANPQVSATQQQLTTHLLSAVGRVAWIDDECLLDAVTALSGSGPAYLFALTEAMARAGEQLGLPASLAADLARQTVIGSAALLQRAELTPAALRAAVTSPGGTTEAALEILLAEKQGLSALLYAAMQAAHKRSQTLATPPH